MAKQLHKRFSTEVIKGLFQKYLYEGMELVYILAEVRICYKDIPRGLYLKDLSNNFNDFDHNRRFHWGRLLIFSLKNLLTN